VKELSHLPHIPWGHLREEVRQERGDWINPDIPLTTGGISGKVGIGEKRKGRGTGSILTYLILLGYIPSKDVSVKS